MQCKISVGKLSFDTCNKVEIKSSLYDVSSTAKIILPKEYKDAKGQNILEYIKVGDKVRDFTWV